LYGTQGRKKAIRTKRSCGPGHYRRGLALRPPIERRDEKPISRCRLQLEGETSQGCSLSRLLGEKRTGFVGITHHHCHATSSHHVGSKIVIVIYAMSDMTIRQKGKRVGPQRTFGVNPTSGRAKTQTHPSVPNLCSNDRRGDGDSEIEYETASKPERKPRGRGRFATRALGGLQRDERQARDAAPKVFAAH